METIKKNIYFWGSHPKANLIGPPMHCSKAPPLFAELRAPFIILCLIPSHLSVGKYHKEWGNTSA